MTPEIDSKGESAPIRVIFYVIQLQELVIGQVWHVARMLHFSKWKLAKIIGGRLPPPPLGPT